ncbi:hypothetical protein [Beijerinckia mobilis]|uniref:hypothetical protein n=1 Tax=Beijerinckia mobilis TaxID=231434 RepID=UPI00055132EC|nr:hypothetical protein [Beijerinckia mobilis]
MGLLIAGCCFLFTGPNPSFARCSQLPFSITEPAVTGFVLAPKNILQTYRDGGPVMDSQVALVVSADTQIALAPMIKLASAASESQRHSIGVGLASAAIACLMNNEEKWTRQISQAVQSSGQRQVIEAFNVALEEKFSALTSQFSFADVLGTPASTHLHNSLSVKSEDPNRPIRSLPSAFKPVKPIIPIQSAIPK